MRSTDWFAADATALAVLTERGGVAPLSAFVAAGLAPHQVAAIFRRGVIARPRTGWYTRPDLPWQATRAIRVGGVLTCLSALAVCFDLAVPPEAWRVVHVCVAPNASRLRHSRDRFLRPPAGTDAEVALHWTCLDPPEAWSVGLVDALLHAAHCAPPDWFVAALDAALHRPRGDTAKLAPDQLAALADELPREARALLDQVDARSESCIETLLRLAMLRRGIRQVEPQVWVTPWWRVDFLVQGKVVIEADGEGTHDPVKDALRDAELRRRGYVVLRFTYDAIVNDMEHVLADIEHVLAAL